MPHLNLRFDYQPLKELSSLKRLLVILFGGIGDLVCLTSSFSAIKRRFPNVELYLLTDPLAKEFFPDGIVDKIFVDEVNFEDCSNDLSADDIAVINLHSTNRSAKLLSAFDNAGLPVYGLLEDNGSLLVRGTIFHDLLHRVFYVRFQDTYIANWIMAGRSTMFSLCLGITEVGEPKISWIRPERGISEDYIVFVPDANAPTRRWPLEYWKELSKIVVDTYGLRPLILGRDRIEGFHPLSINLSGKTTLSQAIGYLPGAVAVISNDTGMIHAAAALGRPVLVLCGPNNVGPEAKGKFLAIRYPVDCSPCFLSHCESMACMESLTPDMVKSALGWLMGKGELDRRLVAGYSWEQDLSLFYDLHSVWDVPYDSTSQVFRNLIRWAWLYALMVEEGLSLEGFAGFEDYFYQFHRINVDSLSPLVASVLERLVTVKGLLLPVREKIGILIRKGGVLTAEVAYSLDSVLTNVERELVYPWNYMVKQNLRDYEFVIRRVLIRIKSMEGFLRRYVKK